VGISADAQEKSDAFRASLSLPFPLVGSREVVRAWGVPWPVFGGVRRVSFVVSRDGRVKSRYHHEVDFTAHVTEALQSLASAG
jgi:peroxiredoxin